MAPGWPMRWLMPTSGCAEHAALKPDRPGASASAGARPEARSLNDTMAMRQVGDGAARWILGALAPVACAARPGAVRRGREGSTAASAPRAPGCRPRKPRASRRARTCPGSPSSSVRVRVSTSQSPRASRTVQATSARADRGSSGRIVKRSAATVCIVRSMSSYRCRPLSWTQSSVTVPATASCRTTRSVRAGSSAVTGSGGAVSTGGSGGSVSSAGSGGRTGSVSVLAPV